MLQHAQVKRWKQRKHVLMQASAGVPVHQQHAWLEVVGHVAQELVGCRLRVEEVVDRKHAGHHVVLPCAGREVGLAQLVVAHEFGCEVAKVCKVNRTSDGEQAWQVQHSMVAGHC